MREPGGKRGDRIIWRNYAKQDISGRRKIDQTDPHVMQTFPEEWEKIPNTVLLFDHNSEEEFRERVLKRVKEAAEKYGIEMYYATEDFPLHMSVKNGKFPKGTMRDEAWLEKARHICRDPGLRRKARELVRALRNKPIDFKFVIFDTEGGSVMLTAVDIPEEIQAFRKFAKDLILGDGFEERNPDPIAHLAFARIKKLPESGAQAALAGFKSEIINIRHELSKKTDNRLLLNARSMYVGVDLFGSVPVRAPAR